MTKVLNWENLHDATLIGISVDWESGRCEIALKPSIAEIPSASIVATDLRNLMIPRKAPWGMSVSINRISWRSDESGEISMLGIEMQSGDTLSVEARSIGIAQSR